jgi:hypothetical protein
VHRGVRLIKFLDSFEVTEEKLRKIADDADEVVRLVKLEDPEFAQKIEFALENKKSELGII